MHTHDASGSWFAEFCRNAVQQEGSVKFTCHKWVQADGHSCLRETGRYHRMQGIPMMRMPVQHCQAFCQAWKWWSKSQEIRIGPLAHLCAMSQDVHGWITQRQCCEEKQKVLQGLKPWGKHWHSIPRVKPCIFSRPVNPSLLSPKWTVFSEPPCVTTQIQGHIRSSRCAKKPKGLIEES